MLADEVPDSMKGKAVQLNHCLFDMLWNKGNKKIPDTLFRTESKTATEDQIGASEADQEEEKKEEE